MKKMVKVVLIIGVVFALMLSISSNSSRQVFLSKAENIDVVVEHNKLSKEKLDNIIGIVAKENKDPMVSINSFNLFCLFGHSLETIYAIVTQHNVSYDAPRCFRRYVSVEACTRNGCNYGSVTELGSSYIYCH